MVIRNRRRRRSSSNHSNRNSPYRAAQAPVSASPARARVCPTQGPDLDLDSHHRVSADSNNHSDNLRVRHRNRN